MFLGCESFVDFNPKEKKELSASGYFRTVSDFESALIGTYDPLIIISYRNALIGDIASDNSVCGGESASDILGLQKIDDYTHDPNNDQLAEVWSYLYEGVNRANYMEENKDKLDFDNKKNIYAQVYFLRAYYYFELVKFFGDVPLFVGKRLTASSSGKLKRSPKADVYKQIEKDLKEAIKDLPASQSEKGRPNKITAHAFLGKVYLYQDKFKEAADEFEKVIGIYSLVDDYGSIFLKSGENNSESIFEVQHSKDSKNYDWGCMACGEGNRGIIYNGIRGYSGPIYDKGWSFNLPTKSLLDAFEAGDKRKDVTILDIEKFAKANPEIIYTKGYEHTGYFNHKYLPRSGYTSAQAELNYENNYRVMRYSDVLLMAAEANNRKSAPDDAKARDYLNKVRRRAFGDDKHDINSSGSDLTKAIWKERRLELAMEGHRFFDLVRTKQAKDEIKGFVENKHEVFPIPQKEIDISKLTQNKGY